ncbi:hypothetical protein BDA96_05G107600 [Sorghum bicolor]|uniref:SREBP regulating gene protein n=1 Tax=Sorghum bicolor TaxID=4558 RepID=A0A921UFD5_SORBI|nr:hypothetical protein BDA96_05G107600 [Sorghum bicolor]
MHGHSQSAAVPPPLLESAAKLAVAAPSPPTRPMPFQRISSLNSGRITHQHRSRSTVQGRHLISDDNGYVCSALSINPWSHCCPTTGDRFSCQGCKLDLQCCNSYEYCVSCCLNPSKIKKEDVLKLKVAKPVTVDAAIALQVWYWFFFPLRVPANKRRMLHAYCHWRSTE